MEAVFKQSAGRVDENTSFFFQITENSLALCFHEKVSRRALVGTHQLKTQTWAIASRNSLHLPPHTTDNH